MPGGTEELLPNVGAASASPSSPVRCTVSTTRAPAITQLPTDELRAGAVKARRPRATRAGEAERSALDGAEHSSMIDRVMAVADTAQAARLALAVLPVRHSTIGCAIACGTGGAIHRPNRVDSPTADTPPLSTGARVDGHGHRQPWRERPRDGAGTISPALAGVAHAMVSSPLIPGGCLRGGEERRRKRSGVTWSSSGTRPAGNVFARGRREDAGRRSAVRVLPVQGTSAEGTTSFSEVVPQVVLDRWSRQATPTREERWRY